METQDKINFIVPRGEAWLGFRAATVQRHLKTDAGAQVTRQQGDYARVEHTRGPWADIHIWALLRVWGFNGCKSLL